ncbi:MAG: hypothetical protein ACPGQS_02520 [Bradymonadia bacterium]
MMKTPDGTWILINWDARQDGVTQWDSRYHVGQQMALSQLGYVLGGLD